jgi:DNA (cytosine-5)-methyltransferase 1
MYNLSMLEFKQYQKTLKEYNYIDLFAGIGGFRLGLDYFGANCVFTSEWNKYASEVYFNNFGEMPEGDITKIKENHIPKHDIICAGFPCQPFSISGSRGGFDDTRGTLFFDIVRIANYHKPKILLLENVRNILSLDSGKVTKKIVETLNDIGYNVFIELLKGNDFGVPQQRERVFFICIREELNVSDFSLSKPSIGPAFVKDILEKSRQKHLEINRNDISINKTNKADLFGSETNKPLRIGTINKGGQGERIYSTDGVGVTLSAFGGGPGRKTGAYLIKNKIRRLTPRECARMMGFPDSFILHTSDTQSFIQFGNAVIVNKVQFIIKDLIDKNIL